MAAVDRALTLPFSWYSSEEVLRRERRAIFAHAWQYAGRAEQVGEPGSFLAADVGGVPVLVTRDRGGELRAFLNVCRHRGAVLTEGCGRRETIQCHYHAWTFDLDGSLRAAPRADREPGFDPADWSLLPAQAGTWGPFLFVNPDPAAEPLAEWLGDLPELLARDIDVNELVFHSRVEFGASANWKVVVENFLECYHCATAHPDFAAAVDVHPDRYDLEAHPTFAAQFCRAKADGDGGQFHLLYPNTGLNVFPGPANLSIGPIAPSGPNRTERYLDYFFLPGTDEAWLAEFFAFDDQVGREDTALVESVHRGMAADVLDHGRLLLNAEPLIAAFQGWVADRLAPASSKSVLREVVDSDLPVLHAYECDPGAAAMAAFPSRDRDAFMAHWAKTLANDSAITRTIVCDGQVAGNIGCWEAGGRRFVGYWLGREFWGRGLATRALGELVGLVEARPLHAHVVAGNAGSIRVLEKCGFVEIGRQTAEDGTVEIEYELAG
jgi:choline monooxygenase